PVDPAPSGYSTGSYGGSAYGAASAENPQSSYGSYRAAPGDPAPSGYVAGSYGSPAYGAASAENPPSSHDASYGAAAADASPSSNYGSNGASAYDTGSYGASAYGSADVPPPGYNRPYAAPSYDTGSYDPSAYQGVGPSAYSSSSGPGNGSADAAPPAYDGSYGASPSAYGSYGAQSSDDPSAYRSASAYETGSSYGVQSTEDSSAYGAHASYDAGLGAVSTPDSPAREQFLAPPAYERPADRYRSIPGVTDPNRPAPGEYGRGTAPAADPPMADYLTRPPMPDPPVRRPAAPMPDPPTPVRRPTAPIPSAARSRKAPKEPPRPPVNRAGRLRMRVNPIACDGHGLCAELLPEIVSLDDWGYPMPVVAEVPAELEGHAQRAAQQCPTLAIILERRQPRTT
ncbi:MAG TPA: ferredoxin, partial [Mycobacteriales bacterium]|nr:ferredoxin [Mycobacteriales bacterium]